MVGSRKKGLSQISPFSIKAHILFLSSSTNCHLTPYKEMRSQRVVPHSLFSDQDIYLFRAGHHYRMYDIMGSTLMEVDGIAGVYFAVWAPHAARVAVAGSFNNWHRETHALFPRGDFSGIYEGFIPGVEKGAVYKYAITDRHGRVFDKGDPYAFRWETPPNTASVVWPLTYSWNDQPWMTERSARPKLGRPLSVYEVHPGSWKKIASEHGLRSLSYRELAQDLVAYVADLGFTHVELMPVMEHPYEPSWGYQITGYYAPTSRFGSPQDFMHLVDAFHQAGIGVILDWVPSHFPSDGHGLAYFDGSHLYEHADPRKGYHPDWTSYIFNYGRYEVRSFLLSNAMFWLSAYHADGLRVDAVASMLYLDYSRKEGEWLPNEMGGRENLEAISLIGELNQAIKKEYPEVLMIAEESTAWPGVSKPVASGGLGFDLKWMMGWMNDTLEYFKNDPYFRQFNQHKLTFSFSYAFSEQFMLPLSHDEVVHGKASLIGRMPGNEAERFANLRLLLSLMWVHPGGQLLFMGGEFGQTTEWNFKSGLEWHLTQYAYHSGVQELVRDLNWLYRREPALYALQYSPEGFEWIAGDDTRNSVISFVRKGNPGDPPLLVVLHFTPVVREAYRSGVPEDGTWEVIFNSDDQKYGGSHLGSQGKLDAVPEHWNGRDHSLLLDLPPLGALVLRRAKSKASKNQKSIGSTRAGSKTKKK